MDATNSELLCNRKIYFLLNWSLSVNLVFFGSMLYLSQWFFEAKEEMFEHILQNLVQWSTSVRIVNSYNLMEKLVII